MKIGVWIREGIEMSRGGAFSYQDKLVQLIDDHDFSDALELCFISSDENFLSRNKEVIRVNDEFLGENVQFSMVERLGLKLPIFKSWIQRRKRKRLRIQLHEIQQLLKENRIEVIYYLTQIGSLVPGIPFITTNWDVGHLSTYAFPEFSNPTSRRHRIQWYDKGIKDALAVFVESNAGKKELVQYTNLNPDRIFVIPMFPGDIVNCNITEGDQNAILKKYQLEAQKFFFYPAQYWAHKNHINLLRAFKKLNEQHGEIKLVLTGGDKGNLAHVVDFIRSNGIEDVHQLGFVSEEELYTFYKNAISLVMPTYLGPTNMPPIEALALGCPVICSDLEGHREQLGDRALYIDPKEYETIYKAMLEMLQPGTRTSFIEKANIAAEHTDAGVNTALDILETHLLEIKKYRIAWGV